MRVPGIPFIQGKNRYGTSTKYAIAVHCTANTASARNEASYATWRTDGVSAHFFADDREVIQSLDTADIAGHAGSWQGNTYSIAVEITGHVHWSRDRWLKSVAWDKLARVLAIVSRHHNIPPVRVTVEQMKANPQVRGAYDHNQMRLAWGGTDHTDPGPNFPWDHLLTVWKRALEGDMALSKGDAQLIAEAVWTRDPNKDAPGAIKNPWRDKATNPTVMPGTALTEILRVAVEEWPQLRRQVDELRTAVKQLAERPAPGQPPEIDYDQLAAALLRHIAKAGNS